MSLIDAFSAHEARHKAQVYRETFGHLAPKPNTTHEGYMVIAWVGYGGDEVVIDADWGGLDDSPWLFDDMHDYLSNLIDRKKVERGNVYKFIGRYTKFKNGRYRFSGRLEVLHDCSKHSANAVAG